MHLIYDWIKKENDVENLIDALKHLGFHVEARSISHIYPLRYRANGKLFTITTGIPFTLFSFPT